MSADKTFDDKINEIVTSIPENLDESTPAWAVFLSGAFRGLCEELRKLNGGLSMRIDQLEVKNHVNEMKIKTLEDEKVMLEEKLVKLETKSMEQELAIDDNAQYSRRNCIVIHGVPEEERENIDRILTQTFNNKVDLGIPVENLVDRDHRVGIRSNGRVTRNNKPKVRPIIVKFTSYRTRSNVLYSKKILKSTGIVVTESLTTRCYKLLLAAQEKFGQRSVWSIDGRIMANVNNKKITITT